MEVRSLKSRCWQAYPSSEISKGEFFLAPYNFWYLSAILAVSWLGDPLLYLCLPSCMAFFSLCVFVFTWCLIFSDKDTNHTRSGPSLMT